MFSQQKNKNTASIFKKLKTASEYIDVYRDGVGIKKGPNIRLSNFQKNLVNPTFTYSHLLALSGLLLMATQVASENTYFAIPDGTNGTNYKLITDGTFGAVIAAIQNGTCGASGVDHAVAYGYDILKTWGERAQLLNGAGDPLYGVDCLTGLVQLVINEQDLQTAAAAAARKAAADAIAAAQEAEREKMARITMGVGGGIGLLIIIGFVLYLIKNMINHNNRNNIDNSARNFRFPHRETEESADSSNAEDDSTAQHLHRLPEAIDTHIKNIAYIDQPVASTSSSEDPEDHPQTSSDESYRPSIDISEEDENYHPEASASESFSSSRSLHTLFQAAPINLITSPPKTLHERLLKIGIKDLSIFERTNTFICPITQAIMTDPVFADDGMTYERSAIETWMKQNNTSPLIKTITIRKLTPNHALRSEIMEFVEAQENLAKNVAVLSNKL